MASQGKKWSQMAFCNISIHCFAQASRISQVAAGAYDLGGSCCIYIMAIFRMEILLYHNVASTSFEWNRFVTFVAHKWACFVHWRNQCNGDASKHEFVCSYPEEVDIGQLAYNAKVDREKKFKSLHLNEMLDFSHCHKHNCIPNTTTTKQPLW